MPEAFERETNFNHLIKQHPCFNGEAHFKYGRIHLPVSPDCNIQCRFCKRGFNKFENRPGVSRCLLSPEAAVEMVSKALEKCPELTVAGIAGPGDTLATDHALNAFELIHRQHPQLINCLSTNGLLLEEKAERIIAAGVRTVTVTVNAIDSDVLQHICSHIIYHGQFFTGPYAARFLIAAQIAGIRKIASLGAVVKINAVLIPGINDHHLGQIAEVTSSLGASLFNIIPLIPQHELQEYPAPDCHQLNMARESAEKYLPVFRHCRHCRADACGIPGKGRDLSEGLYDQGLNTFSHG
ncbi:MAG TPA: nitrogen fixation protein NifB [Firmicutes bacterium]|jgi:nitrogen fixation protein NifB|nr:nitrogen fixation protein NifB [Bacillota bacterium]